MVCVSVVQFPHLLPPPCRTRQIQKSAWSAAFPAIQNKKKTICTCTNLLENFKNKCVVVVVVVKKLVTCV